MEPEEARQLEPEGRPCSDSGPPDGSVPLVSVILPVHNGEAWLDECLHALLAQTFLSRHERWSLELSAFDDGSSDGSWPKLTAWAAPLHAHGIRTRLGRSGAARGGGCGYAKNRAVRQSRGAWLCFQDVDDVMLPSRVATQLDAARDRPSALLGARVRREPPESTPRYIRWANAMSDDELVLHRFRECTLLMPTWFIGREAFDAVGGFREEPCEDLLFLQAHVARGGALHRAGGEEPLVVYRYHEHAATHGIARRTIFRHRAEAIERSVLGGWPRFTIWGAGRDGRDFFKCLSGASRARVVAFCDVDPKKIGTEYVYEQYRVPVVHFSAAEPPFVTCVALDRTGGAFEKNLASLGLTEGVDYYHFC
ncbi:hypothetical protein AB1Y20_022132 [Prymnesium parvum]|uniref:Glycosyltransferase 2-like domain-containing protein n=1 Tax=Prymnesium parvum TaxID=97485 RepID=A0AB34JGG0_PRYPA